MQFIEKLKEAEKAGIEIGLEQGNNKKARETAAIMLAEGEPLDKIARYTGLSTEEIGTIQLEEL